MLRNLYTCIWEPVGHNGKSKGVEKVHLLVYERWRYTSHDSVYFIANIMVSDEGARRFVP